MSERVRIQMRRLGMLSARRWARVGASRATTGSLSSLPPLHTRRTLACLSRRRLALLAPPLVPHPLIISALQFYLSGPHSTPAPLSSSPSLPSPAPSLFLTSALPPTAPPSSALPWSPNARALTLCSLEPRWEESEEKGIEGSGKGWEE